MNASSSGLSTIIPIYILTVAAKFGYGITSALATAFLDASLTLMSKYFRKLALKAAS